MSILDTVTRVREAEEEAGRILEEAHRQEKASVAEALEKRRALLAEAKSSAREKILAVQDAIGKEKAEILRLQASGIEGEKGALREKAARRSGEAALTALDLFLSACRKDR